MGFESRDYSRDGSYTASLSAWGMDLTPVVADESKNIVDYVGAFVRTFENDVRKKMSSRLGS